jgi:hypothetical protein
MSTYADDIKRIAREKENPGGLGSALIRKSIPGSTKVMGDVEKEDVGQEMLAPITLEILTYDDTQDVEVTTPTGTATIKTAETAQIIDANDKVWTIDTIIYPVV